MKALLVWPKFPVTYWGGQYSIGLIGKRAFMPPLGLLTIAALCPPEWQLRLVDLNADELSDDHLEWADMVLISGMVIQHESMMTTIARCKRRGVTTAVGGPHATSSPEKFENADHLVLDEGEVTFAAFLSDLKEGKVQRVYTANGEKPDIKQTPIPRFDLLNVESYSHMCVQFSRGCPFSCEFCDITTLFGNNPRTKKPEQIVAELQVIYDLGFRGEVFLVDDNFIGNKKSVKQMLPTLIEWMTRHEYPFWLYTEASINLADDDELLDLMCAAGFHSVFIGIESPSQESLKETQKFQNLSGNLLSKVHKIQERGIEVMAGFIVGFDSDGEDIFERQIEFITKARIPMAMIGPLQAMPNTQLWDRLKIEGRLMTDFEGDTFGFCNFETRMPALTITRGYRTVLSSLYTAESYFARLRTLIESMKGGSNRTLGRLSPSMKMKYSFKLLRALGWLIVASKHRGEYFSFFTWILRNHPDKLLFAIARAIVGNHFIRYTSEVMIPRLTSREAELKETPQLSIAS
ncbi:MAG: B12-binding domain-containing radical SAM protein [Candidatus Obscuribacterales bacterium]|nr:B12-binding domain-containing radical SAM protein [Candidatus Obscuribacterales bacterium]